MRIVISDYSGHPFQVQLSRELARRGHEILHLFSTSFQTPKGRLTKLEDDPETFHITGVSTREPFAKHTFVKRRFQEIEIGKAIGAQIEAFGPDVVVSSNAPLDTQKQILAATRQAGAKFVFWVQDIYSHAIAEVLRKKIPVLGGMIGAHYRHLEAKMIAAADHAVVISPDFEVPVRELAGSGVPITVIQNWAPLDEISRYERDSIWAKENLPQSPFRMIYSGTIGFKHNPELLLALADGVDGDVLVFSEGTAADWLKREAAKRGLTNLHVSGWLSFDDLPKALSAADVLIVILEPEAGIYSVPSKVLTYMCIGRPILGAMPIENLAARNITTNGMGMVVAPDDKDALIETARSMATSPEKREAMGKAAHDYANETFNIASITDKFITVFGTLN